MQDIDFDEIDRAVSSVTGRAGRSVMSDPKTDLKSDPEAVAVTPTSSPAVRRSSGRFMDVVHPSSDMRPSQSSASPATTAPISERPDRQLQERPDYQDRQAQAVTPRDNVAKRSEPASSASTAFHWPDPIDFASPKPEPVVTAMPNITPPVETDHEMDIEAIESIESNDDTTEMIDQNEFTGPLESPFLSGTKVEKRPLGAFSGADADLPLIEDPFPSYPTVAEQPESQLEIAPELHEEVLLLEARAPDQDEALKLEATNIDAIESIAVATDVETPLGPTSITQQYKEHPSTASQSTGSIYDTEAYSQPLTKPTKKYAGILVVVWILSLILIGGGIAAAVYFLVLPKLG